MVSLSSLAAFAIALIVVSVNADNDPCPTNILPTSSCGEVSATAISEFDKKSLVQAINTFRRHYSYKASTVVWNNNLAELAQMWANECSDEKIPDSCNPSGVHQLVYKGPYAEFPYEALRQGIWTNEQILKPPANTEYLILDIVGCGRVLANEGNYLVCNFA